MTTKMRASLLPMMFSLVTLSVTGMLCRTGDGARTTTGLGCEIPVEWRGRYFQSSLGVLIVSRKGITTKGVCIDHSADYFLFRNRENNCFQCLLLLRQHRNIIQYKESYCSSVSTTLKLVCAEIRVETPLYTLIREPAMPVACPFRESSYRFDFSDLSHGFCGQPASSAHPCSLPSRFQMHFSGCVKGPRFQKKDVEMECLATWKDGSETYLYSRLTGSGLSTKDDRYRCFKYQIYGNDVSMAMTADATCRGLRSSVDGPFLFELHKDESVVSQSKCRFPDWLKGVTWRTLNGKYRYRVEDDGSATYRSEEHRPNEKSFTLYRCLESQQRVDIRNEIAVISSMSIRNCSYVLQCLTIERISAQVIRFTEGQERDSPVNCQHEEYGNYEILIPADVASSSCPNPGVHHTAPSGGCIHRLNIGCQDENTILIDHSCSPGQPGLVFECIASWTEGQTVFVVLRTFNDSLLQCFSFKQDGALVIFSSDVNCHRNWSLPLFQTPLSYSILRRENCKRAAKTTDAMEMVTDRQALAKTTTNFFDYHFHLGDMSLLDYDDFEFQKTSTDETMRRQHHDIASSKDVGGYDDNYDDDDDDDGYDDDYDDEASEGISVEFSGMDLGGRLGDERRDAIDKYDEPFYPTQRQSWSSEFPRTKASNSEPRVNGDSFLFITQPPTVFRLSVVLSNEDPIAERKRKGSRDRIRAESNGESSKEFVNRSAATTDLGRLTVSHLFSLLLFLLCWVLRSHVEYRST